MDSQSELETKPLPNFQVFSEYGIYEIAPQNGQEKVVIVSQPSWSKFLKAIDGHDYGQAFVLSPELITVADKDFRKMIEYRDEVGDDLEQARKISLAHSETTYIIGSPDFSSLGPPFNAAFVFHNGEMQIMHKRLPSMGDIKFFQFNPKDDPLSIRQQGILVCSDLLGVAMPGDGALALQAQLMTGSREFSLQLLGTKFADDNIDSLLVLACWGIGGNVKAINAKTRGNITQEGINAYYLLTLKWACKEAFLNCPSLKRVVVCDSAFLPEEVEMFKQKGELVASQPMSLVASR